MIDFWVKFIITCALGVIVARMIMAEYSYQSMTDTVEDSIDESITYVINSIAKYSIDAADIQRRKEPQDLKSDRVRELLTRTIKENVQLRARLAMLIEVYVANVFLLSKGGIELDQWANRMRIFTCETQQEFVALLTIATDLRTMVPVNQIFLNASINAADHLILRNFIQLVDGIKRESSVERFGEVIVSLIADHWMETVICSIRRDPYLRDHFELKREKARTFVHENPMPIILKRKDNGFPDYRWAIANSPVFCKFFMVKIFMTYFEDAFFNDETYWLNEALGEMARQETEEDANLLNEMFHDLLLNYIDVMEVVIVSQQFVHNIIEAKLGLVEQIWKVQKKTTVPTIYRVLRDRESLLMRQKTNTFVWNFMPRIML